MRRMRARHDDCSILIGEIEAVSHELQRQTGAHAYHFPVLAGVGEGGTMALAVEPGCDGVHRRPALPALMIAVSSAAESARL